MKPSLPIDRAFLKTRPLPELAIESGKDDRGTVLVVAGSREVPGAALLAAEAALRVGAGKLQIATVHSMAACLAVAMPEARVISLAETADGEIDPSSISRLTDAAERADAVLIGPGMMAEDSARALSLAILNATAASVILDAAAMTAMRGEEAALRACRGRLAITPHPGEMARFLGVDRDVVLADPQAAGLRAAAVTEAVVAMKGASTFVCAPSGKSWSCEGGGVGMATSGSGDVLAGIVAGLAARGAKPLCAMQWGVFLHAEAGRRLALTTGTVGYLARELAREVPMILNAIGP